MHPIRSLVFGIVLLAQVVPAGAQVAPAPIEFRDDVSMEEFMLVLGRMPPAVTQAALAYRSAFQSRCGRPLRTVELRRAFAEGEGNPTLMAMIGAAHQRNDARLQQLGNQVACGER